VTDVVLRVHPPVRKCQGIVAQHEVIRDSICWCEADAAEAAMSEQMRGLAQTRVGARELRRKRHTRRPGVRT